MSGNLKTTPSTGSPSFCSVAKLARGPEHFEAILHPPGMPFAHLLGLATIAAELGGGLLVLACAFVPLAAVPMFVVLLAAIVTVHLPNGSSSIKLMSYDAAGAHFDQTGTRRTFYTSRESSRYV